MDPVRQSLALYKGNLAKLKQDPKYVESVSGKLLREGGASSEELWDRVSEIATQTNDNHHNVDVLRQKKNLGE